jgi:hypothetical protein
MFAENQTAKNSQVFFESLQRTIRNEKAESEIETEK